MSLENWRKNGWLTPAEPTNSEVVQLLAVADRSIKDAQVDGLSTDSVYMFAYDAALTICTIVLRAHGYRVAKGTSHHKRTIESLPLTLGAETQPISDAIELASRLRNQAMYDHVDVAQGKDAVELLEISIALRERCVQFLQNESPELLG
jgi:hypothetical protein